VPYFVSRVHIGSFGKQCVGCYDIVVESSQMQGRSESEPESPSTEENAADIFMPLLGSFIESRAAHLKQRERKNSNNLDQ
jgi:hypothetical protein